MKVSECLAKVETDKIFHHQYGEAYDDIFKSFDREAPLNILEVGTQKGGSLLAWKEYFPNANVYGIDIVDVVPDKYRVDTVTRIIADIKDWRNNIEWDIVIDDGSHWLPDVVYVIAEYTNKLKVGGVIVIEDVRFPNLLGAVIANIFQDMVIARVIDEKVIWQIQSYDSRRVGAETSYIITLSKQLKENI